VAVLTPSERATRRRIESLIRLAAPALDLVLFAGDKVSRFAGRNELDPEPPRRMMGPGGARTPIGGPAERAD
jgi:hypothetical protein